VGHLPIAKRWLTRWYWNCHPILIYLGGVMRVDCGTVAGLGKLFPSPPSLLSHFLKNHVGLQNLKGILSLFCCIKFNFYYFNCYLFYFEFFLLIFFSVSSCGIWFYIKFDLYSSYCYFLFLFFNFIPCYFFMSNLVSILFIVICFVFLFFFIDFFLFYSLIFCWLRIWCRDFFEFAFYGVSLDLITRVTSFEN